MNFKSATLFILALLPLLVFSQVDFGCPPLPDRDPPTKITDLRPNDVKVVMGMGDSITAGFGALSSLNESRGLSFSMGGDPGAITVPNFLSYYNPNLVGYSINGYPSEVCYGNDCPALHYYPGDDGNNAAKSGSMVVDMVSMQINYLIRQVNQNPNSDVQSDWKVLSIMIGANDLCASCAFNLTYLSPDDYESNLMSSLERLRTALPRTFVNLIASPNISQAYNLSLQTNSCVNAQRPLFIQCDCLFAPKAGALRATIDGLMAQFNQRAAKVASYYQQKAYDDFAVVVQPFMRDTNISQLPTRFLSNQDCFHPSQDGQEAMATALWNSMLTPSAYKQTHLDMADIPICPDQTTLLYTF